MPTRNTIKNMYLGQQKAMQDYSVDTRQGLPVSSIGNVATAKHALVGWTRKDGFEGMMDFRHRRPLQATAFRERFSTISGHMRLKA